MKKTLQDQYLSIKEGKGHKGVFLTEAKRQFPNIVRNAATFEEAVASLQTKNIISENVIGLTAVNSPFSPSKKESYELAYEAFLAEAKKKKENEDEKVKAEEKKPSKKVEEDYSHAYDQKDNKDIDNLIFDQVMTGYYAELKDPKNADKTMQELKDIVMKNLAKDPIHYTKDGQFGVKDLGYTTEAPGLGTPKEAKGKYKASGYGDLNESIQPINEEESKLRKVIREIIAEELANDSKVSLKEGVEKELAEINKEAEREIIASKLEKVQALIDKKQSQLTKLDEDEDMKDLTDKKKVKEIEKDIKSLEKAKAKLEKMMGKKGGKAKKEVIDEIDDENEYEREEMAAKYVKDANNRQDAGQKISSILSNYPNLSLNNRHKLEDELEDRSENYDLAVRGITPKLDDLDGNDLNQEDIESIIDTYNAKSKPWMKLESDELEMLKLDLIGKYLGTDNE
jgi:hypothetical protein